MLAAACALGPQPQPIAALVLTLALLVLNVAVWAWQPAHRFVARWSHMPGTEHTRGTTHGTRDTKPALVQDLRARVARAFMHVDGTHLAENMLALSALGGLVLPRTCASACVPASARPTACTSAPPSTPAAGSVPLAASMAIAYVLGSVAGLGGPGSAQTTQSAPVVGASAGLAAWVGILATSCACSSSPWPSWTASTTPPATVLLAAAAGIAWTYAAVRHARPGHHGSDGSRPAAATGGRDPRAHALGFIFGCGVSAGARLVRYMVHGVHDLWAA